MNETDRKAFYQSWSAAWEQCGRSVTDTQLRFAFECVRNFELSEIQRALLQHARDPDVGQHPPKPADIVRQLQGGTSENVAEAWSKVIRALERHGPYARIVFDDPAIHAAIESVGWYGLCTASYERMSFLQRDFESAYRGARGTRHYPAVICAHPEHRGELVYIGDPEKAQQVQALGYDKGERRTGAMTVSEAVGRLQ